MKRLIMFMVMVFALVSAVFAGGNVDVSTITPQDVTRLEKIVDDLEPTKAINTALASLKPNPNGFLGIMYEYRKIQETKINAIFNEYGITFNTINTYTTSDQKLNVLLAKLKSRYSYLEGLDTKKVEELRAILALL